MAVITVELLADFANKFAAKITEKFAKKTDIPTIPEGAKFTDTTYSVMTAATASKAGTSGLVPAPAAGSQGKYLRGDGTWETPPDTNTVYAHPTSAGNKHIPSGGSSGQILRWSADGTAVWGDDNNTTYSAATSSNAGLMSAEDKTKLDGMTEATTADIDNIIAGTFT